MRFFRRNPITKPETTPKPPEAPAGVTRILLISNCQVQPLKHGLANVCERVQIDAVPIHLIPPDERPANFSKYIQNKNNYDLVLSIFLSEDFGELSTDRIHKTFAPIPVLTIANLYFDGTLPDICYIGGLNARTPGPIGDYHSRIALLGYLMNLPVATTVNLYCDAVYQQLGYYDAFRRSLDEMARRDEGTDIPLGNLLEEKVREGNCFLSQNHPTSLLLTAYINRIGEHLAKNGYVTSSGLRLSQEDFINFLAQSVIFPVYPEIAARHGLPYQTSYVFRTATAGDEPSRPISLSDFVTAEYAAFHDADQKVLAAFWPGSELMDKYGRDATFKTLVANLAHSA